MNVLSKLREATPADYDSLGALVYDAIHHGPTQYSPAQSRAWMAAPPKGDAWAKRMAGKQVIVADAGHALVGFMTLEPGGYVDFAYVRPEAQGSGLFRRLFETVEARAIEAGETALSTHASLMAQPAFAAMGFQIDHHETIEKDGEQLARAKMTKPLTKDDA